MLDVHPNQTININLSNFSGFLFKKKKKEERKRKKGKGSSWGPEKVPKTRSKLSAMSILVGTFIPNQDKKQTDGTIISKH